MPCAERAGMSGSPRSPSTSWRSLAVKQGDLARADALFRENLMLARRSASAASSPVRSPESHGFSPDEATPRRQLVICGAVDTMLDVTGMNLTPTGQISYDHALATARHDLDEATFNAAREAGRAMRPDAILAEVNREPTVGARPGEDQRTVPTGYASV